jgi:hypothetical protein
VVFTLQGRTREQIRVAIGDNLGAVFVGTATGGGDTTSLLDTALRGSNDEFNGRYVRLTSGTNDGENFRVDDYVASTSDITLVPAATASISSGDTYELWEEPYDPKVIDRFIQAAIVAASDRVYDPEEDISLFADKNTARFDIPSKFAMLTDVYRRSGVTARTIHSCSRDFDETNDAQMVDSLDTQDKKTGTASLKIATTAGNGSFISDSFTAIDLSKYTHVEGWFKATTTLAAADFVLRLDDGTVTGDSNDKEVISLPATTAADTWTYFRVALANPESDTAIASIGLEYNANSGTNTVWFDDIKATVSGTEVWERIPSHLWKIDAQARDLIFTDGGRSFAGNSLLKLVGGDKPAVIAADSTSNEIDDEYVIADATSRALMGYSGGSFTDAEERRNLAAFWRGHAEKRWRAMPMLVNVRKVS